MGIYAMAMGVSHSEPPRDNFIIYIYIYNLFVKVGWFDQHEDFPDWLLAGRTMEMGINIGPYLYPEFDQMKQHLFHQKSDNCQFPFGFVFRNQ